MYSIHIDANEHWHRSSEISETKWYNYNKIRISNERLWEISQNNENIDAWIRENIQFENWVEWIGIVNLPYRSFSFKDPKDEMLFIMRWL